MNTICIPLNPSRVQQLKEYHDWIEKNPDESNLTDYWEIHSKKIKIKFKNDSVTLTGESGFYFPKKLNPYTQLRRTIGQLPINLSYWIFIYSRNLLNRQYDFLSTYSKAYDNIRNNDPLLYRGSYKRGINWDKLQNAVLDFKTSRDMKKKYPASKTHTLDDTTIKSYFYLQLIENIVSSLKNCTVCEIGPGTGNMASLLYHHFNTKLFLVDLPMTFFFSSAFLMQFCPAAKIALPHETAGINFDPEGYDIIMMTPQQTHQMQDQSIDLTVNLHSMQEMNDQVIRSYFDLIDRTTKPGGYLFCANRVEKVMDGKLLRFVDYPWRSQTRTIVYELDPLLKLVNISPGFIRMEQYT